MYPANPLALHVLNSIDIKNTMQFCLRGRHEHEQMLPGGISNLIRKQQETEYLELTERDTKTRNGNGDSRLCLKKEAKQFVH